MIRGDVIRLPADRNARGHEQQGPRYGVVVQADELATLSTVIVAPTSRSARPASFRPEIEVQNERTQVLVEQLRAVDIERLRAPTSHLSLDEMHAVDLALALVLDLTVAGPGDG